MMDSSPVEAAPRQPWPSLWFTAAASLIAQLALCQFFSFGKFVPVSIDINPNNLWKYAYHFPPRGEFLTLNWFGVANLPPTLNPFSLAASHLPAWIFFTMYAPLVGTAALFAMVAFLRELDLPRPAALFGGVAFAWQGDLLPFVFPGHYGYITTWPFFALAAWAALRARYHWAYALIAGASCGMMIGLQPDRGSMASLLIAALYLTPAVFCRVTLSSQLRPLLVCAGTAALVSVAAFLALFQSYIIGVKLGAATDRDQVYHFATQFSLGPVETLTYLVPGFFGWHSSNMTGPYWGWIGQAPGYNFTHEGTRNLNLAISTTGTVVSILAVLGACMLLPRTAGRFFGRDRYTQRQIDFGRVLIAVGLLGLVLAWGYHTSLYRVLFALPLMDKWRDPLKWLEYFNFAVVTLAAYGTSQFVQSVTDITARRPLRLFLAVTTGFLAALFLTSYPLAILIAGFLNGSYQPIEIANVMHTLHVSLAYAVALSVLLWICVAGVWQGDRLQNWDIVNPWLRRQWHQVLAVENRAATLAVCCALLAVVQLAWVAAQFIEPRELSQLTATNPLLDSLRAEGPQVRVAVPQPQDSLLNFYLQNQFAADRISSVDVSAASRIPDALTAFVNAFSGHTAKLWTIGGVKNVAIAQSDMATLRQEPEVASNIASADGYTIASNPDGQPSHALVRMRDYFAKTTFVPRAEIMTDQDNAKNDAALLKRLADPKWNPRETVLLTQTGTGSFHESDRSRLEPIPTPSGKPPAVTVNITRYTPHEIDFTVDTPAAGYVLINDQFDPDWQVTLNEKRASLLRADYLLRALAVGPERSDISLRYAAHYRFAGLTLPVIAVDDFSDAVMLLAFVGGGILVHRSKRADAES